MKWSLKKKCIVMLSWVIDIFGGIWGDFTVLVLLLSRLLSLS